jgi:hypothetical protein
MAPSSRRRSQKANRQRPVCSSFNVASRDHAGRCKHGLPFAQCAACTPQMVVSRAGPHLPATITLICRECRSQLVTEDANRTGLAGWLMRIRRDHSRSSHPELVDTFASAVVVMRCEPCAAQIDTLDVNTQSLADEVMASRSDHERAKHS